MIFFVFFGFDCLPARNGEHIPVPAAKHKVNKKSFNFDFMQ